MTAATDSIGEIVVVSLQASIQVLLMALVGAAACRMGIMSYETQKGLNGLLVTIITPCMLFTRVAEVVTPERFLQWWPLLITALVYAFVGIGIGSVASRILHIRADMRPLFMSAMGFKNTGSLPLSMAASLCAGSPILLAGPADTPAAATTRAAAYCLFFTALTSILRWSVAYRLLSPPDAGTPSSISSASSHSSEAFIMVDAFHRDDVESLYNDADPLLNDELKRQPLPASTPPPPPSRWPRWRLCALPAAWLASLKRLGRGAFGRAVTAVWRAVAQVMNPPLVAAMAALGVGLITPVKGIFFGDDALLYPTVTRTLEFIGDCTIPMVMLNLGAKLVYYRTETSHASTLSPSSLGVKGNVAVIVLNQFIFPLFGIAWVLMLAAIGGLVRTDPVLTFVLLLQACSPAAVNLLTLADMHATHEVAAANLLFYSYVVAIVSMTVWAVAHLEILENFGSIFGA